MIMVAWDNEMSCEPCGLDCMAAPRQTGRVSQACVLYKDDSLRCEFDNLMMVMETGKKSKIRGVVDTEQRGPLLGRSGRQRKRTTASDDEGSGILLGNLIAPRSVTVSRPVGLYLVCLVRGTQGHLNGSAHGCLRLVIQGKSH